MPNIKSAKKRVLVAEKKNMQNKMIKSQLKTDIKKFNAAAEMGWVVLKFTPQQLMTHDTIVTLRTTIAKRVEEMARMAIPAQSNR